MRLVFALLFSFLCAFVAGGAAAQDMPPEGSTIKEKLVLGRSTFALPPGNWQVVATGTGDVLRDGTTVIGKTAQAYLVQYNENRQFVAAMFHRVPLSSASVSRWNDSLCERKHVLFYDAFRGRHDYPECLHIDHSVPWFWRSAPKHPFDRKIWDWFLANRISNPVAAISANYKNHFSGDFVLTRLSVNPEAFGQDRSTKTVWSESEWDPLTYDQDPKRRAFIENLQKWAYAMADNARSTLRNRKPRDAMLPSLDELRVR